MKEPLNLKCGFCAAQPQGHGPFVQTRGETVFCWESKDAQPLVMLLD